MANRISRTDCPAGCEWTFITKGGMKTHLKNKHPDWRPTLRDRATLTDEALDNADEASFTTDIIGTVHWESDIRAVADAARDHALRVVLEDMEPLAWESEQLQAMHHPSGKGDCGTCLNIRRALATFRRWQTEVQDDN